MKPSEWLSEKDSHGIYDSEQQKLKYKDATGLTAPGWSSWQVDQEFVRNVRATGGDLDESSIGLQVTGGYQMAEAVASILCQFSSSKMGRGSRFRDCIAALKAAGF